MPYIRQIREAFNEGVVMWSRLHKQTSKEMVNKSLSTSRKKRKRECYEDFKRRTSMKMFDDASGVIEGDGGSGGSEWSEESESGGLHQGGSIEPDAVDKQHKGDCTDIDTRKSGDECTRATMEPEQTHDLVTRANENNGLGSEVYPNVSEPRVIGNKVTINFQHKPMNKVTPTVLTKTAIFKNKKTIKPKLKMSTGQLNHRTNLPNHVVNILSKLTLNEEETDKINHFIYNYIHNFYNDEIMFFVNKLQKINLV